MNDVTYGYLDHVLIAAGLETHKISTTHTRCQPPHELNNHKNSTTHKYSTTHNNSTITRTQSSQELNHTRELNHYKNLTTNNNSTITTAQPSQQLNHTHIIPDIFMSIPKNLTRLTHTTNTHTYSIWSTPWCLNVKTYWQFLTKHPTKLQVGDRLSWYHCN